MIPSQYERIDFSFMTLGELEIMCKEMVQSGPSDSESDREFLVTLVNEIAERKKQQ